VSPEAKTPDVEITRESGGYSDVDKGQHKEQHQEQQQQEENQEQNRDRQQKYATKLGDKKPCAVGRLMGLG
jgi:hypothetical protein